MIDPDSLDDMVPKDRWAFYYVHRNGWLTTDISRVQGKCVGVVEARSEDEALKVAKERALL